MSLKNKEWLSSKKNFFLPVKLISSLFRSKFMDYLKQKYDNNKLFFSGKIQHLQNESNFQKLVDTLYDKDWVVFSKPSLANPEAVIEYLSRYTIYVNNVDNSYSRESWQDILFRLTGKDLSICPDCGGNTVWFNILYLKFIF